MLDTIKTGNPMETKELGATIVTTMKILLRMNNSLLTMRRDNMQPTLQNQLKPLATQVGFYDQTYYDYYWEQWDETVSECTHINVLELRAVRRTLEHLGSNLRGLHVTVFADNTTAMVCIGKGDSVILKPCQTHTEAIWEITERQNILLKVKGWRTRRLTGPPGCLQKWRSGC